MHATAYTACKNIRISFDIGDCPTIGEQFPLRGYNATHTRTHTHVYTPVEFCFLAILCLYSSGVCCPGGATFISYIEEEKQ